ncbi:MAG: hypothetical protein JZU47_14290 [Prolixibacteraceae bacterium]|nr:hypothetical protein [Prolixibacteraceae bacterium]
MISYEMKFGVSDIARILNVDKNLVKDWAYYFSDYLNPKANPEKGIEREFTADDLCTFGYIFMYWEDKTDFESIKYGLNSNSQFEYPYNELAIEVTPIFREFSEELLGGKVWMLGGHTKSNDKISLADSYKLAGDALIDFGIENEYNDEIIYPAIYNYRHATELYLKAVIPNPQSTFPNDGKTHNLLTLYNELLNLLKNKYATTPPKWFENIILAFNDFDPDGTSFRYGLKADIDEMFIDLIHIKKLMNWFSESFHNIKKRQSEI